MRLSAVLHEETLFESDSHGDGIWLEAGTKVAVVDGFVSEKNVILVASTENRGTVCTAEVPFSAVTAMLEEN